jgi:hypothetical protein
MAIGEIYAYIKVLGGYVLLIPFGLKCGYNKPSPLFYFSLY